MKSKFTFFRKSLLVGVGLLIIGAASAETTFPIIVEAESFNPTTKRYAFVDGRAGFSGGQGLGMEASYGSYARYNVNVTAAGTYDLAIYYATMQKRSFYVKINNQISTPLVTDLTTSWDGTGVDGIKSTLTQIYLEAGDNTIELGGYYHPQADNSHAPAIDKFEITESTTTISEPETQITPIVLETESALLSGASVGNFSAFSGGQGVGGSLSNQSMMTFNNITVAESGTYDLSIYYATMDTRSSYVKVNYQKSQIVEFNDHSNNWGDGSNSDNQPAVRMKTVQIYLVAGVNKLTIGASSTHSANLDKISIVKSGLNIVQPVNETVSAVFDYTDNSSETLEQNVTNTDNLRNLFDNDEFTLYSVPGVTSTQITVMTKYPIALNGYSIANAPENPASMDNWVVEYSIDGSTNWTVFTPTTVTNNANIRIGRKDNRNTPAQYYRLTATGNTNIAIAEWQLHGVPYLNTTAQFPEDLTTNVASLTASNPGIVEIWNEVYQNTIDNSFSNKYTTNGTNVFWLEYALQDAKIVKSYSLSVPFSDVERNPRTWTLSGYENDAWVELDSRTNIKFAVQGSTLLFNIAQPKICTKYKLNVTANNGSGSNAQLLEWQLFENFIDITTGIADKQLDTESNLIISTETGRILINSLNNNNAPVHIYNVAGQKTYSGICKQGQNEIVVSRGLYIVNVGGSVNKIIVR